MQQQQQESIAQQQNQGQFGPDAHDFDEYSDQGQEGHEGQEWDHWTRQVQDMIQGLEARFTNLEARALASFQDAAKAMDGINGAVANAVG